MGKILERLRCGEGVMKKNTKIVEFDSDDLVSRLKTTIENIEFQKGKVFWDDLHRLYLILDVLKKCIIN